MVTSLQNEIPKARINITLDLFTDGARKKKELPHKILVLGDFTQGKNQLVLSERERISIDRSNFDAVLNNLSPEICINVPNRIKKNDDELQVKININSLKRFSPDEIIKQVPELERLLAMRNLLKDLKSNLIDNLVFRRELEKIIKSKAQLQLLKQELIAIEKGDLCRT